MAKRISKKRSLIYKNIPQKVIIPVLIGIIFVFIGLFIAFFHFVSLRQLAGNVSSVVLSPFEHNELTPLPAPKPPPPHLFTFTQTPLLTRLQNSQTRIVFSQDSKIWIARLDGSSPISVVLPTGIDPQPVSAITDGWIYYLVRQYKEYPTKILAYNYMTGKIRYITEPAKSNYFTEIAQTSIPTERDLILYKVAYVETSCLWTKKKESCGGNLTVPGFRGGAYAYDPVIGKSIYLGDLTFLDYPRYPSIESTGDFIYAAKNNQYVLVNTKTGDTQTTSSPCYEGQDFSCIPVDNDYRINTYAKQQLMLQGTNDNWVFDNSANVASDTILLSPDHRFAVYMQSKVEGGISYFLLDLTNHSTREMFADSSNVVRCISWVSNSSVLCHQEDIHTSPVSYHHFLLNIFTNKKTTIVPGDSVSF